MSVVTLHGPLKKLAGRSEHPVAGSTVSELLRELERAQPAVGGWILDERGLIRRHLNVFVNGEQASEDTTVGADDRVEVLQAISGGGPVVLLGTFARKWRGYGAGRQGRREPPYWVSTGVTEDTACRFRRPPFSAKRFERGR
jgi:molybdopterin synthase sulfur carrier subunit